MSERKSPTRRTIIRDAKLNRDYTKLPNAILRDRRLRLDTKGLLWHLLSLPPDWKIRPAALARRLSPEQGRPIGRERLRRMFEELRAAGYMARSKEQVHDDESGYWGSFVYIVGANPDDVAKAVEAQRNSVTFLPQAGLPSTDEPSSAKPTSYKRNTVTNNSRLQREKTEVQFSNAVTAESQHSCPTERRSQRFSKVNSDRGRIEIDLANRIGPDGLDVLAALTPQQIDYLCARQRRGTLDQSEIERLRTRHMLVRSNGRTAA